MVDKTPVKEFERIRPDDEPLRLDPFARDPAGIIAVLDAATDINRTHAARHGNIVVVTQKVADEVLVTGDLHGHRDNFKSILRMAALNKHPRRHLILQEVCHGGPEYRNGACRSHRVVEAVARLTVLCPGRIHFVLGNHELAELHRHPIAKERGVLQIESFHRGLEFAYGDRADDVSAAIRRFVEACPLAVRLPGGIVVCHSVPDRVVNRGFDVSIFERPIESQDCQQGGAVFELVWGRDYRTSNIRAFREMLNANFLINGHTRGVNGVLLPNSFQAILDCSDRPASVVLLPVDPKLTRGDVLRRIQMLPE